MLYAIGTLVNYWAGKAILEGNIKQNLKQTVFERHCQKKIWRGRSLL